MFPLEEREQLRSKLILAARSDGRITGAAHLGSAATGSLDQWSDIDLALCVAPGVNLADVLGDWTMRVYRDCGAVTHFDVKRGEILYRVFLLQNSLQIDISFWAAGEFRAIGPKFKLIFGTPSEPQPAPSPDLKDLIGMGWLYALHVRSAIARRRLLQAEYMLSGMRNEVLALACTRHGLVAVQGRGFDDLPPDFKTNAEECFPQSLDADELRKAFRKTTAVLLSEIRHVDEELERKVERPLLDLVNTLSAH